MKGDIEIKEKLLLIVNVLKKDLNYKFTLEDIFSPVRDKDLVTIRSIISYCLRKHNYSYPQIGRLLNRTHATIINLDKHFEKNIDKDKEPYKKTLSKIHFLLSQGGIVKKLKAEEAELNKIENRLKKLRIQIAQMYFDYENL